MNLAPRRGPEPTEGLRAGDSVGVQVAGGLKAPYRSCGQRAVSAVHRAR